MAQDACLDRLPEELITHIAKSCDVLSALRLSTTSQKVRSAVYDSLVFRSILEDSQRTQWQWATLKMPSLHQVAEKSPQFWARFALADEKAVELAQKDCPLESRPNFIRWLPALFTVKHPFMYHKSWAAPLPEGNYQPLQAIFCVAMAILASDEAMPKLSRSFRLQEHSILVHGVDSTAFLWALCQIALDVRVSLRTRQAAWPYNNHANVPLIPLPTAMQIPIMQDTPLPFAKSSAFNEWYQHSGVLFSTADYLVNGAWCGYYTHLGQWNPHVDPPMTNINFRIVGTPPSSSHELSLKAEGCRDAVGPFTVTGAFKHPAATEDGGKRIGDGMTFTALKQYTNSSTAWRWDLRVTPFGLVGFWAFPEGRGRGYGHTRPVTTGIQRCGLVWLWKEGWTAAA